LNRKAIAKLGNPKFLNFCYDEEGMVLYCAPTKQDDLDAYEIPKFYWDLPQKPCEISRSALLKALQHRLNWASGSKYYFEGDVFSLNNKPILAYNLRNGVKVR